MVMHESQYPLLAYDLFIQTLNFNYKNPEHLEGNVTPMKEQILLHNTINIQWLTIHERNGFCVFLLSVLKKEMQWI